MRYSLDILSPTLRAVHISLCAAEVDQALSESGPEALNQAEATEKLAHTCLDSLLAAEALRPVSPYVLEGGPAEPGQALNISCSFEVLPELPQTEALDKSALEKISVDVAAPELSASEINAALEKPRRARARLVPVTRRPTDGDVVLMDVQGFMNGEPVPGLSAPGCRIRLRSQAAGADPVSETVRTLLPGEEGEGEMTVPQSHADPLLRGKTARFRVRLQSVHAEELPPLDNDLAQTLGFGNVDELTRFALAKALEQKIIAIKEKARAELLEKLMSGLEFPVPEYLVAAHQRDFMAEARHNLSRQGLDGQNLAQALEALRPEALTFARAQAKAQTYLMAVGEKAGVRVDEQALEARLQGLAEEQGSNSEAARKAWLRDGTAQDMSDRLLAHRAWDYLYQCVHKRVLSCGGSPLPA